MLTDGVRTFLRAQRVARLATATADGVPVVAITSTGVRGFGLEPSALG